MATIASLDEDLLGVDIAVPDDADDDALVTPTGDLALASGRDAMRRNLRRRMLASTGDLVHRVDYGCGLLEAVELPLRPATLAELGNRIRRGVLRDPRVAEAQVLTSRGLPGDAGAPTAHALTVELRVRLRRSLGDETLTISTSG